MPPMLPEAQTDQDDFATGKPGRWDRRHWSDLEAIASRTRNTADRNTKSDVDLIPDIWARHILFANALYDSRHMLHESAQAAFRGFLALLALRVRKNILLKAEELRLDSASEWPFALAARNLTSAGHAINQLYTDTSWNEIYLFRGDGRSLLGVTSPLTLVCPAQGPALKGLANLPSAWFDGAQLRDPSAPGVLNDSDRGLLTGWLEQLRQKLAEPRRQGLILWRYGHTGLLHAISEFEKALGTTTGAAVQMAEGSLRMGASAYSYLAAALRPEEVALEHSDLLLDSSLPGTPVLLPIRVSDKDVSIEPRTEPSKITVVTGTSLLDINTTLWGENKRILAGRPLPEDAEWIDPKSLFLERMYLLKGTQQRSGMSHARGQRDVADQLSYYPVMPFSQRLTELLPAAQIVQNVRFSTENHGSGDVVVVKLRLPLRGGKVLEVTHSYNADQQSSIDQIPVLEVWPPFRRPGWKHYNTFWWTNTETAFAAEPFPLGKSGRLVEQGENLAGNHVSVTSLDSAPDGFLLKVPHPLRGRSELLPAGIIFNRFMDVSEVSPSGTWAAGVDFGTSSTHVVLRAGKDGGEHPLQLAQSGPLRVVVGRDADRPRALYQYFLPFSPEKAETAETSPFLSFLRMRHPERTSFEAISGAHVLFYSPSHNIQELSAGRLATNLKWDDESRSRSRPYLQQICLQAAAEAVIAGAERMDWFYSLPAAFSFHKQQDYGREWMSMCDFITEETGLGRTQEPTNMMESFATARYFKEREEAPPEVGAIFLDIGAGTCDISIWQEGKERCGLSIRFAGRDLFLAPLFEMRERMLPEFARIDPEHLSELTVQRLAGDKNPNEFFAHAEAMLRDAGTPLAGKLRDQARLEAVALPLRFGIAGLFYYVGIILQHLEHVGQFKRNLGGIYIGGNGSQLLHWADGGKYLQSGSLAVLLTDSLFAGANWTGNAPRNVQIKLSAKPKQEAAIGLVVMSNLPQGEHWSDIVAGEPFTLPGGEAKSEFDRVSREAVRDAQLAGLPQLGRFYDNYLQRAKAIGYPPVTLKKDELFARAEERVRQFLADQKGKAEEDLDATPPFIKALQMLIIGIAREAGKTLSASSSGR